MTSLSMTTTPIISKSGDLPRNATDSPDNVNSDISSRLTGLDQCYVSKVLHMLGFGNRSTGCHQTMRGNAADHAHCASKLQEKKCVTLPSQSVAKQTWMLYGGESPSCCGDFSFASASPAVAYVADGVGHNYQGAARDTRDKIAQVWEAFNADLTSPELNMTTHDDALCDRLRDLSNQFEAHCKGSTLSLAWLANEGCCDVLKTVNIGDSAILLRRAGQWHVVQGYDDPSVHMNLPVDLREVSIVETPLFDGDIILGVTDGVFDVLKSDSGDIDTVFHRLNTLVSDDASSSEIGANIKQYAEEHIPIDNPDDCSYFVMSYQPNQVAGQKSMRG